MVIVRNGENQDRAFEAFGPGEVDRHVRNLIHICWMVMPPGKKTLDDVEREIRRVLDRALRDLREDQKLRDGE